MGHVTEGVLRRYLDEPGSVSDADQDHLATCGRCETQLSDAAADRSAIEGVLSETHTAEPDLDVAWSRLSARLAEGGDVQAPIPLSAAREHRTTRTHRSKRYQVVAGVTAGLLVIGGTAAAAAANWLPIFRTESVTPVTISMADVTSLSSLSGLADLKDYGSLTLPSMLEPAKVPDAATAQARTGLAVPQVADLPKGVQGTPAYYVAQHQTATFTFSAAKAEAAAKAGALTLPPIPAGLDGSTLKVDAGPAVAQVWSQGSGIPSLIVARMNPPAASSQGASLAQVRDYLLSVPGIPADLSTQLRTITDDGRTLPIPVLKGQMNSSRTTIAGAPATVLESRGGYGAGVVWISGGRLTVVAGLLDSDEILGLARGLR